MLDSVDTVEEGVFEELGSRGPISGAAEATIDEVPDLGVPDLGYHGGSNLGGDLLVYLGSAVALIERCLQARNPRYTISASPHLW